MLTEQAGAWASTSASCLAAAMQQAAFPQRLGYAMQEAALTQRLG